MAVKLQVDVLAFGKDGLRQEGEFGFHQAAVKVRSANLDREHAAFAGEEPREGDFQLAVGEHEEGLVAQGFRVGGDGLASAGAGGGGDSLEGFRCDAMHLGDGAEPVGGAFLAKGEGGGDTFGAAACQRMGRVGQEGLGQDEAGVRADLRRAGGAAGGQEADVLDAHLRQKRQALVFHDVRQRADDEEIRVGGFLQPRDHRGQAGIFALCEGRLDARAGVVVDPDRAAVAGVQTFGGAREVQLDDLGRAGADEEELANVGAAGEKAFDFAFKFLVRIGQTGEVLLFENRCAESRLGENHHSGGGLQEVGAGAAAHDQEEGVLHLAVQPDDSGEAAEHLTLATFAQNRGVEAAGCGGVKAHAGWPFGVLSRRARRSFSRNWVAFRK